MVHDSEAEKRRAAERSIDFVEDGMVLGLGSGSTAAQVVRALGERVRDGLRLRGVPTSRATAALAEAEGIPLLTLEEMTRVDLTIDGADEVDPELRLVKGGGGALLREKVVASVSAKLVIVVDSSKLVPRLGVFPLPVEVTPFAWKVVSEALGETGVRPILRCGRDGEPFVTDGGNYILDCACGVIEDPDGFARRLDSIAGVIEHGLFIGMADCVVVGRAGGTEVIGRSAGAPRR